MFDSIDRPESTEPNQSPVLIRCPATSARRIRITALKTARDPIENQSVFALAELLVFNADSNLAIGKSVTATFTQSYLRSELCHRWIHAVFPSTNEQENQDELFYSPSG